MSDDLTKLVTILRFVQDNMAKTMATVLVRLIRDQRNYNKVIEEVRQAKLDDLLSMDKSLRYTEMVSSLDQE